MNDIVLTRTEEIQTLFTYFCKYGQIESIKSIYQTYHTIIQNETIFPFSFVTACQYGKLTVAKWLLDVYPSIQTEHSICEMALLKAGANNHSDIVKWILLITKKE